MIIKDLFLSKEEFEVIANENGMLATSPIPEDLESYYQSEDYLSHKEEKTTWFEKVYEAVQNTNHRLKYKLLKGNGKQLLDYGCGDGSFLQYMKQKGFIVSGYEPNAKAQKIAKQKIGEEKVFTTIPNDAVFDHITLWHVLEHVPNPSEVLNQLKSYLGENGRLWIALPNYESYDAQFYKTFWAAWDVPRHLWHFSPISFEMFCKKNGLKIVRKHPLWFDAFYVSIVSEKYQGRSALFAYFLGGMIGLISNIKAVFNGQYSSVIYEVKSLPQPSH